MSTNLLPQSNLRWLLRRDGSKRSVAANELRIVEFPATAQCSIKLDDNEQLIELRSGQRSLCREKELLCVQYFKVGSRAGEISLRRQLDGLLIRGHGLFKLRTCGRILFTRNQRIRN